MNDVQTLYDIFVSVKSKAFVRVVDSKARARTIGDSDLQDTFSTPTEICLTISFSNGSCSSSATLISNEHI